MNYQQLDRVKFETAFIESARLGATASIFHGLMFLALLISTKLGDSGPWKYSVAFVLFGSGAWRAWILVNARELNRRTEPIPRFQFQTHLRATAFVLGLAWALTFIMSVREFGFAAPTIGIYVLLIAFVPASLSLCAMDMFISASFILLTGVPIITACFCVDEPNVPTSALGFLFIVHVFYNLNLVRRYSITFFKTMQNQLEVEAQKQQLEGILNAVPGYVAWLDKDGITLGTNRLFTSAFELSGQKIKGQHYEKVIGENTQITSLVARFQESDTEQAVHEVRARLNGESRWYILALRKFLTATGFNIVAVAVDISNEKMAQEELASEKQRATQSERLSLIGAMAGGVAHEINNPLAIIRGRLEKIQELGEAGELTQEQAAQISKKAIQTVDRIARIVRGLRLMARGESSDAQTIYNLVDLCRDVMELAASKARQTEARVEFVCHETSMETLCQPTHVSQIILNLVQNSLDAIEGDTERWVQIDLSRNVGQVVISVTDSGKLSSIAQPDLIFEPFFTTKAAGEGCGLGLSISQTLARRYGGDLRLNLTSRNTCFQLILLREAATDAAFEAASEAGNRSLPTEGKPSRAVA